jgi:hypothetical protein
MKLPARVLFKHTLLLLCTDCCTISALCTHEIACTHIMHIVQAHPAAPVHRLSHDISLFAHKRTPYYIRPHTIPHYTAHQTILNRTPYHIRPYPYYAYHTILYRYI